MRLDQQLSQEQIKALSVNQVTVIAILKRLNFLGSEMRWPYLDGHGNTKTAVVRAEDIVSIIKWDV